jgi:hypothetical protein
LSAVAGPAVRARAARPARTPVGVRFAAIGCLVGVAVTHQLDLADKLEEAPYLAVMFIALIVAYLDDDRDLDPERPGSLMYWHRTSLGGPILQWHLHKNAEGGFSRYKMTHLWLVPGMVDAYSMEMPVVALRERFRTPLNGTGTGL